MRLLRHLNEVTVKQAIADIQEPKPGPQSSMKVVEEWMAIIEKSCSQIIKEYKKADEFFYRGSHGRDFVEKEGRITKVRPPKDTPIEVHRFLNKLYKEKFGWKVRDGVVATPNTHTAETYGRVHIFFPVNGYKYVWSRKVKDMYRALPLELRKLIFRRLKSKKDRQGAILKNENEVRRIVDLFQDTGIQHALKNENEIMFRTKKWYGIHERFEILVAQYIGMEH